MARIFTKDLGTTIPNRKDTSQWVELGLCTDFNLETGDFTYIIGMEVTDFENVPDGIAKRTFPAATYAVFTTPTVPHEEMVSSIHQTWNAVFSEWFPIQAMNIAALQSLNYTMSVATKIKVSSLKWNFGYR